MGRVFELYKIWENGESRERACSELGLRRLIIGEDSMILDERQDRVSELRMQFFKTMRTSFRAPISESMGSCGNISLPRARLVEWKAGKENRVKNNEGRGTCTLACAGLTKLAELYKLRLGYEMRNLTFHTAVRLRVCEKYEGKARTYRYN